MAISTRRKARSGALCGTYNRLSERNDESDGDSNERQISDTEREVSRLPGTLVGRWSDPEASAYRKGAKRPGFDDLLAAFDAGEINTVVVWRVDRLARASREWAKVLTRVDDHGLRIVDCFGCDSSTTNGRYMLGMLAEAARNESAVMGARQARAAHERAEKGLPARTRYRAFGHTDEQDALVEPEASMLRSAAYRVAAYEATHHDISVEWREAGYHRTPTGVRRMLLQPRIVGAREVDDVLVISGAIAPILADEHGQPDVETFERLRARLALPGGPGRPRTATLLAGTAHCGRCAERMTTGSVDGVWRYSCHKRRANANRAHDVGCGRVSIRLDLVDEIVSEAVLQVLDGTVARRDAPDDRPLLAELREIAARRKRLARAWADGEIDDDSWRSARAGLDERERHVSARLTRRGPIVVDDVRAEWKRRPLSWRRALVQSVVARVEIAPAATPGRFDPDRVTIVWQEEQPVDAGE